MFGSGGWSCGVSGGKVTYLEEETGSPKADQGLSVTIPVYYESEW